MPNIPSSQYQPGNSDFVWSQLYESLTPYVWKHVHSIGLQSWFDQEYDVVQDIVQETVVRIYLYMRNADVLSPSHFGRRIAHNYSEDLRRKEAHFIQVKHSTCQGEAEDNDNIWDYRTNPTDPIVEALEDIAFLALLIEVAPIIAAFPCKQRTALLIDLANLSDFGDEPGPLETAFLEVGINLREYQQELSKERKSRSRHCSLLSVAYKRLRETAYPHLLQLGLA